MTYKAHFHFRDESTMHLV